MMGINNQFLEETVFAVANGYGNVNLTKDIIQGEMMYQLIDGEPKSLNKKLGLPANSSYTDYLKHSVMGVAEEDREEFLQMFDRNHLLKCYENGEHHVSNRYWIRFPNQEPLYVENHFAMFRDEETGDILAVDYILDRTEHYRIKKQQEELEEKNKRLQHALRYEREYAGMLSALKRIYWQILYVDLSTGVYSIIHSDKNVDVTGKITGDAKDVFQKSVKLYVKDEYREEISNFLDINTLCHRIVGGDVISAEYMDSTGEWKECAFIALQRNSQGAALSALFTIRDISKEKKQQMEQNRLLELRMNTISEAIHGGFKLGKNDEKFSFIRVSEQLANMLGYDTAQELVEASEGCMVTIVHPEDAAREMPGAKKSIETGEMYTMHYRLRCKDGTWKNVEDRGRLIVNEKGEEEFWSFIVDQDLLTQLETANIAKSNFLFNMSHDIRTPMNALLGYNKLMKKELSDPKLLEYQEKMEQSGNLLLSIINNVLDMARIESGKTELNEGCYAVDHLLDDVVCVFEEAAQKKDIHFTYELHVEHTYVMCDATKVKEIFINLISNAIKYTPEGGNVTVVTGEIPCEKDGYVCLKTEVIDTGVGMSKEYLPQLFESFSRERNTTMGKVAGTGLGMSIVKSLVDMMGGTIDVESELGKGTKFSVILQHRISDEISRKHKNMISEAEMREVIKGKKILLAEDNEMNAEIAMIILEDMGFVVERVEDGCQCVAKIEQMPPDAYDVILMDIQMPNMNGYNATQQIRQLSDGAKANIPIVAMTANAFLEDKNRALENGMNAHIAKPIDEDKVMEILFTIFEQ